MKKTKIYLNQNQQKSPTHLTPADEAWDKMTALLDSEMPVVNKETKKRAFTISFSQFAISVVAAMMLVGGTFITLKTIDHKKEIRAIKHSIMHSEHDSLVNATVQFEDSAISAETDVQSSISANQKSNEEEVLNQLQNNNQTSLSTTITQTNTLQKVVFVKKFNLNNVSVGNAGLNTNNSDNVANHIKKQHETTFIDSVNTQNHQLSSTLPEAEKPSKVVSETKIGINDSLDVRNSYPIVPLMTNEKEKKRAVGNNYQKNNHLFIGLSGYNSLLFSKNMSKNIYSYGEILTIGIRNTKYNLTVETGIGFQSLEYHVPYSRTLYIYQATGMYDSTVTVSLYKYSRYNLTVPFFITNEIFNYNSISLDIKAGMNTSVFLSRQRLFNQLPTDIQLVDDSYSITNLNFAFALSPQFRWDINDKFSFNMNAGAIFYLNSLYQNYSLKPVGMNLSAGVNYFF